MSGRPPAGPKIDDVVKYMEKLQAEKRSAELSVQKFANDRDRVDEQIENLRAKRNDIEARLQMEKERFERLDRTIVRAEETLGKLVDSSKTLADFVKREYEDTRRD
ncbi:hypothetical protein WR25_00884 [Diploscapter pachys]|uniref:Uncharacterized protein n=1 Tax=Diploscapter pachys TaxID=2018661 RepID=A0A2A2KVW6_9BILA|nr:hypothetical protein WR25_00884 [Diploscapter pachys]